ncbi:Cysteine-rich membrane protein 2 [Spironucleus salmonicida]|uniref:Cysteine-rich membrane protein 2 n=1 Tax=Spironucleus salmonicida TaxID=348837 RepID=V6LF20_9EUKA|nr:Cysteine-rich membrane protein 2 [Spironucleus salmonicida]|eukprot:EST42868.1 Cysteine-rich membrane protein 2 [Spironucleus salmonicida]
MTETGTCSNAVLNCNAGYFCPAEDSTTVNCEPCSEDMEYGQSCYCQDSKPIDNCQECTDKKCSTCVRNTFLQNNKCENCPFFCDTCADPNSCITCSNGYKMNPDTKLCETTCQNSDTCAASNQGFCNPATLTCQYCIHNCVLCSSTTICDFCEPNEFVTTVEGQCTKKCENIDNGNYCENGVPKLCVTDLTSECKCGNASQCASCNKSQDQCETCLPHWKLNEAGECADCEDGFSLVNKNCVLCTSTQTTACTCSTAKNCQACDANMSKCKTCIGNFDPSGPIPCSKCKDKFFEDTSKTPHECVTCHAPCTTCSSSSNCTACADGFSLESNYCVSCADENCNTCPSQISTCTACKDGFSVQSGKCVKHCTAIAECEFNQICDKICKTCSDNCATCKETVEKCTTCKSGFIIENQKCIACPSGCANCADDKNICKVCNNSFFAKEGTCTACDGNKTEKCTCGNAENCATCDSSDSAKCGNCITGYEKAKDETCAICADGYLMVGMVCTKCNNNCATCSKSVEKCDTCASSYTMSINQTCEKDCTGEMDDGNVCTADNVVECGGNDQITACKCKDAANCFKCDSSDKEKCESCMAGYKFVNQQCDGCADGYTAVGKLCILQDETLSTNLSSGAVAGIVIAVLVVVGGVAGGVFWYMKKTKVNQEIEKQNFSRQ